MTIFDMISDTSYKKKHVLRQLIKHHIGFSEQEMIRHYDDDVTTEHYDMIDRDYTRYDRDKEPLEYILGYVTFFERRFVVTRDTLIPRPETEYMIEAVIQHVLEGGKTILCDVGTGCGVLGLSVFLEVGKHLSSLHLSDLSDKALTVAQKNAARYQVSDCFFYHSDMLAYRSEREVMGDVCVVANLPYIPDRTFDEEVEENVKAREPRMAFVGGDDGLDLYRKLLDEVVSYGAMYTRCVCFLEVMTFQIALLEQEYEEWNFEVIRTFHFQIQIVKAERRATPGK